VYIRKGIKFHNGEDLTADDVKFTFDYSMSDAAVTKQATFKTVIKSVEKVDDYTVRLLLNGQQPYLLVVMASTPAYTMVLPKDYFDKYGPEYFEEHPVGSGPYKVVGHTPGDSVEYVAWDGYWDPNLLSGD